MQQATFLAPSSPSVSLVKGRPATTSLEVTKFFGKRHDAVLRDIRNLVDNCPKEFAAHNFVETPYTEGQNGQSYTMFILFRDGFMLLVMGYTGKKAMQIKIAYIEAFNQMEAQVLGKPALPSTVTPSTAADRRPLDKLVKVWTQQSGTVHAQAWTQVNAHFNLDPVTQLPVEWIPDAIALVEEKINALATIEAKPEPAALPPSSVPAEALQNTARLFENISKAEAALSGAENWIHIKVRMELCRDMNALPVENAVNMHVNTAWYALGLARSSLMAAMSVRRLSGNFTPNGTARA